MLTLFARRAVPCLWPREPSAAGISSEDALSQGCRYRPSRRLNVVPFTSFQISRVPIRTLSVKQRPFLTAGRLRIPGILWMLFIIGREPSSSFVQSHDTGFSRSRKHYSSSPNSWSTQSDIPAIAKSITREALECALATTGNGTDMAIHAPQTSQLMHSPGTRRGFKAVRTHDSRARTITAGFKTQIACSTQSESRLRSALLEKDISLV
ncbi:hypothetical protein BDV97DRAFT_362762 [Delphinella strobiligena]|nr:hypothetical protein BDV97DRAFT_362762 [Delphinella strobiligena]